MSADETPIATPALDAQAARALFERLRWPDGPTCPRCASRDVAAREGGTARAGLRRCRACRSDFTVTVGTALERSHLPLEDWVKAADLMASIKGGVSARRLQKELGVTYKTAWTMARRLRAALREV